MHWGFVLHDWHGRHLVPGPTAVGVGYSSTYRLGSAMVVSHWQTYGDRGSISDLATCSL